jgi:hypothetical protein
MNLFRRKPKKDWDLELRLYLIENPQKKQVGERVNINYEGYEDGVKASGVIVKVEGPYVTDELRLYREPTKWVHPRVYWIWNEKGKYCAEVMEGYIK